MAETAPERLTKKLLRHMLMSGVKSALCYHYNLGFLQIRAVDDFLRGVDAFKNTDPLKLHAELSAFNEQWMEWAGSSRPLGEIRNRAKSMKEYFKLLLNCVLPGFRKSQASYCSQVFPDVFLQKEVTVVDERKGVFFTYRKDLGKIFANFRYFLAVYFKLGKTEKVVREWNRRIGEIQSLDFWEKCLGLQ